MAGERRLPREAAETAREHEKRNERDCAQAHTHERDARGSNGRFILFALILVPAGAGLSTGTASREPNGDFYATAAQVIATLFLAIAVEFFARQASAIGLQDAIVALVLAGQSWVGFFACVRALTGAASDVTRGLTTMGITAASVLLALGLYDTMTSRDDVSEREKSVAGFVILIVLFAAIALLLF